MTFGVECLVLLNLSIIPIPDNYAQKVQSQYFRTQTTHFQKGYTMLVKTPARSTSFFTPNFTPSENTISANSSIFSRESSEVSWWQRQSPANQRRAIVDSTIQDIGKFHHIPSSKEWVRSVIRLAARGSVEIPTNRNNYSWQAAVNIISYPKYPLRKISPGMIVQMDWLCPNNKSYPHTAIVIKTDESGLIWVDCGWKNRGLVESRRILNSCFENAVGNRYTVYEIL